MSLVVHLLLSSHVIPMFVGVKTHPVAVLQVSVVQTLLSLQVIVVPLQTPAEQTSLVVQALLSLHASVFSVWTHPRTRSQESSVQGLLSLQLVGPPASQTPCEQASPVVHA